MTTQPISDTENKMNIYLVLILHIFPGLLVFTFDIVMVPIVKGLNIPLMFTLVLADLIILIPVESFIIIYFSKKSYMSFDIKKLIPYFEPMPRTRFIGFLFALIVWAVLINMLLMPLSSYLIENVFSGFPEVFLSTEASVLKNTNFSVYSQLNLLILLILAFIGIGIGVPVVEELYFRGFLMSSMDRFEIGAPIISVILWSIYHVWAPWSIVVYIISFIPVAVAVYKTKNIYLAIIGHMIANIVLVLNLIPILFG